MLTLAVTLGVASCAGEEANVGSGDGEASAQESLVEAARSTHELDALILRFAQGRELTDERAVEVAIQKPDRIRNTSRITPGGADQVVIQIGDDAWASVPEDPERFEHRPDAATASVDGLLEPLQLLTYAESVERDGNDYEFSIPADNPVSKSEMTGTATVANGLVVELFLDDREADIVTTWEFERAPDLKIEAPET